MNTIRFTRRVVLVLVLFALPGLARAADVAAGKNVAQVTCAGCHDTSDQPRPASARVQGSPPPFVLLAKEKMQRENLRAFLQQPHGKMDNVVLNRRDVDNVIAYIESLRRVRLTPKS